MEKIYLKFNKIIHKIKLNFAKMLIIYLVLYFLWNLPTIISKLTANKVYIFTTVSFGFIVIFCVFIIILIIFNIADKIKYSIKQIKIYGVRFKRYKPYIYTDIDEYPKVYLFKVACLYRYNRIIITDKFLDTGINIVNIIKRYIPEANDKLLSNVLSYINTYHKKRMNKDAGIERGKMQLKFENQDTVLFLAVYQIYGYGDIERTYEMQQVYEIITNNNELLHAVKELKLSSIFLYEVPLPWDPDYVEIKDEESEELYKLQYQTIEELFCELDKAGYERWKEYVLNFFNEFDKLSIEKAKEFLKLTDYEVPEEWYDILMNKKYLKYTEKYKQISK